MIKIEFPADRQDVARAMGRALLEIAGDELPVTLVPGDLEVSGDTTVSGQIQLAEDVEVEVTGRSGVDSNGVPFNPEFCSSAKDPFYGSGKRVGQWKRRKGVSEEAYDAWYAEAYDGVVQTEPEPVNTSEAFASDVPPAPSDVGEFMGWVSKKQADEVLSPEDIGRAYVECKIETMHLFPPNDADVVAQRVKQLYEFLLPLAGA